MSYFVPTAGLEETRSRSLSEGELGNTSRPQNQEPLREIDAPTGEAVGPPSSSQLSFRTLAPTRECDSSLSPHE